MNASARLSPLLIAPLIVALILAMPPPADAADAEAGAALYRLECAVCHGTQGKGDGVAAPLLDPKPRDFRPGLFKLRSTESGELPTDADLERTVTRGIPATAMPSFQHLGSERIKNLVAHVKTLGGPEGEQGSWFELYDVPPAEKVPPRPPFTEEAKRNGKRLYTEMGCDGCHGKTGRGDGKKPAELLDHRGLPVHSRDFTLGIYKGGSRPEDLYMRILTGMDGGPMTGFWKDAMTAEERWALVGYLITFATPHDIEQPSRGIVAVQGGATTASLNDSRWEQGHAVRVLRMPLEGGWMRRFDPLKVEAIGGRSDLALRIAWDDGDNSCPSLRVAFPTAGRTPTFTLGTAERPLRIWQWSREGEQDKVQTFDSHGIGKEMLVASALHAQSNREGSRWTLLLSGPIPEQAEQLAVFAAGCSAKGRYGTASTFYDLAFSAENAPSMAGGN